MASDDDGPDGARKDNPADQEWTRQESVRAKRGKHGAKVIESTGTVERVFTVTFRSTGNNVNMNRVHHGLVEKIFEAVPGVIFRPTSDTTTSTKKSMTMISQFPTTEIGHGNFFARRQKGKTIEVDHKIHSAMTVKEIKTKVMSYLRPNNIFIEKGELDGIELFRFGYLQGAHPRLVNRIDLENRINEAIREFDSLDEYWEIHAPMWDKAKEIPLVSVYKKEIGWGMGASRVTSECVTLMAIRPVCVLYKHIISECKGLFHYDFIPTGVATMTTAEQMKDLLINNNDIQNSVQGISVMGLPDMAFELEYCHNNQVKTIEQWILHHPGVEIIEPTDDSYTDGRWIVVVLRDEYENAKQWITEIITQVPELLTATEHAIFAAKYEIFPPAIFTNAPLGGKMQKEVYETYARVMAKKDRYNKAVTKTNVWNKPTPIFFDAMPESEPGPGTNLKKHKTKKTNEEANSIESTVRTNPTRTAQTSVSNDIDTIVSRIDTVVSQYTQVFERFMQDAREQRIEDGKRREEERKAKEEALLVERRARSEELRKYEDRREEDRKMYEAQRLIERETMAKMQADERRERAEEKRLTEARFERMLQEHKEQQAEMFKLIASVLSTAQNQLPMPFPQFPPPFYPHPYPMVSPPLFNPQPPYDQHTGLIQTQPTEGQHYQQAQDSQNGYNPPEIQHDQGSEPELITRPLETHGTATHLQDLTIEHDLNQEKRTERHSSPTIDNTKPSRPGDNDPTPLCQTPSRPTQRHRERAGQRRRYDQITETPGSVEAIENVQQGSRSSDWDGDNGRDEDNLGEIARKIVFDGEMTTTTKTGSTPAKDSPMEDVDPQNQTEKPLVASPTRHE